MMDRMSELRLKRNLWQLYLVLTVLIMVFIFFQSALPAELSDRESGGIVRLLAGWLNADADWLTFVVRKAAHFTEYLVLGLALAGTVRGVSAMRAERRSSPGKNGDRTARGVSAMRTERRSSRGENGGSRMPESEPRANNRSIRWVSFFPAWAVGTVYAITDEVHQFFVPGRSCEARDVAIDSCGVAAGVLIWLLIRKMRRKR